MNDTGIWTNVANLGFPIVISIYLLTRTEKKIESLTESINKLNNLIEKNFSGKGGLQ